MARRVKKTDNREVDHWVSTDDGRHLPIDKDGNIIFGSSSKNSTYKKNLNGTYQRKEKRDGVLVQATAIPGRDKGKDFYTIKTGVGDDFESSDKKYSTLSSAKNAADKALENRLNSKEDTSKSDSSKKKAIDEPASSSKSKDPLERKRSAALDKISKMKDLDDYDREDIEYLYKDTGGAWIHSDAMERAIEAPLSGKKTATEKSLRRNFDNMMRDWEDVAYTTGSKEAKKFLESEMKDYKNRFEANMKQWSDNKSSNSNKPKSAAPEKKPIQVTDKQKRTAQAYLKNVNWKSAVDGEQSAEISDRHWGWAGMSNEKMANVLNTVDPEHEYRIEHATEEKRMMGVKTKVNHQYIVRDKITPEVTGSKKRSSAPKPTRKTTSSKTNKLKDIFKGEKSSMVEWKINRAYDKTSLKELALEAGVSAAKVRNMSADELRSMLLSMWKGK